MPTTQTPPPPRLALVGDRSPAVVAHDRIPLLFRALAGGSEETIELYWLHSATITDPRDLDGFDGIWIVPGSPYEHRDGVLAAIYKARTDDVPMLGTCGGFQHLLLEFARNVCGLPAVENAEQHPEASELLIVPLRCSLLGEEATVTIAPGSVAAGAMGAGPSAERFFCRYGLSARYEDLLQRHGLVVSGRDEFGDARVVELPGRRFFVGSLFQPELTSDATWVHPLIVAFASAVRAHAARYSIAAS
jgi:CTP synthase (UTP-ammonia lyase)